MQKCAYVQINAFSCKLLVYAAYCAVHISLQGCVSDEQPKRLAHVILLRWLAKEYCLLEWGHRRKQWNKRRYYVLFVC